MRRINKKHYVNQTDQILSTVTVDSGDKVARRGLPYYSNYRRIIGFALIACAVGVSTETALFASRKGSIRGNESVNFSKGSKLTSETRRRIQAEATVPLTPPTKKPTAFPTTSECYYVFIKLVFDSKPEEISWEVTRHPDDSIEPVKRSLYMTPEEIMREKLRRTIDISQTIVSSDPYITGKMDESKELCLSVGNYKFTIYDSGEDGMGEGSYKISTNNAEIIAEGGSFGSSETIAFELPTLGMTKS